MDSYNFTIAIFSAVLLVFMISYARYGLITSSTYYKLCNKSLWRDITFVIPCLFYGLVLGFRYDYAWDWDQYRNTFEFIKQGNLFREDTELGYIAINWILASCGLNFYSIFILEGLVYIYSICYLLKDHRKLWITVIPIVYIVNSFNCLNISRQFFAISVFLIAIRNLIDSKLKRYLLLSIIAILIHTAIAPFVVLFLFVNFIDKVKLKPLPVFVIYIFCLLFQQFFFDKIIEYSTILQQTIFTNKAYADSMMDEKYVREMMGGKQMYYKIIMQLSYIYLYFYVVIKKNLLSKFDSRILRLYLVIGLIAQFFEVAAGSHELTSRFFYTTNIFTQVGWGIIIYVIFTNIKIVTPIAFILVLFYIIKTIMSFYIDIYTTMVLNGFFIEYK